MSAPHPNVSCDCVVFGFDQEKLMVLLIEQEARENLTPQLALPGDHVWHNEDLDDAAKRVLKELTNLDGIYLKQFKTFGDPNRLRGLKDQDWLRAFRPDPSVRVITVGYYSLVNLEMYQPQAASFAGKVVWQPIDEIPELAFDHNQILSTALQELRQAFQLHNIAVELLPKKFTLSMLQHLHEIVLNVELDKRNFRKKIKKLGHLIPLDEKEQGVDHKPAQLFSFK